nr:uncharacterized protein LOC100180036 [Ciona intestinalis]|eukprot:XP_002125500.1 uncharacterized protein LOC100180036 [Ciona intestinalis]
MSATPEQSDEIKESVLNPTFHDIQVKKVEICTPETATVKFQEQHFPIEEYETHEVAKEEFVSYRTKAAKSPCLKPLKESAEENRLVSRSNSQNVAVVTVPPDPQLLASCQSRRGQRPLLEGGAERRLRLQELHQRKQEIIDSLAQQTGHRRRSGVRRQERNAPRYFEVSPGVFITERPESRLQAANSAQSRTYGEYRSSTSPNKARVWNRSASSRAISSNSSRWKTEQLPQAKTNHFVKMPFKQVPALTMDANYKINDEMVYPGEEMRAMTAFTVSRIRHAFRRMPDPPRLDSRQGRLLKAKLKPLRPVALKGPDVNSCQGIQPEYRRKQGYSLSPSRQRHLKEQYLEVCKMHEGNTLEEEYEKRLNSTTPDHSIHPTSPEPETNLGFSNEILANIQPDFLSTSENVSSHNAAYDDYARQDRITMERQFSTMHLESSVIF